MQTTLVILDNIKTRFNLKQLFKWFVNHVIDHVLIKIKC